MSDSAKIKEIDEIATLVEYNSISEIPHDVLNNINFGSLDSSNINPVKNLIESGKNSFEKYFRIHFKQGKAKWEQIRNIRIWKNKGEYRTDEKLLTNATEVHYDGGIGFDTPTMQKSKKAIHPIPNTIPNGANIGINGKLDGYLDKEGFSDWIIIQVQSTKNTPYGRGKAIHQKAIAFQFTVF